MKIRIFLIALLFSAYSWGQVNIATIGTPVTENFDALTNGTWTNGTTASGWYARTSAGTGVTISAYGANTGSTTTAGLYAYGANLTNPLSDRGLGYANSNAFTGGSGVGKGFYGWRLKNNTGSTISSLTVAWTGEEWRKSGTTTAQTLILSYQAVASPGTITDPSTGTWTAAGSTFSSPINTAGASALDGNAPANRIPLTVNISVSLAPGDEIMLRWEDLNDTGNDNFMAIDDISVTANIQAIAVASTSWDLPATWNTGSVPTANTNVLIPSPYSVYLGSSITRNAGTSTTVAVGGTLKTDITGGTNSWTYTNTVGSTTTINGTFELDNAAVVAGSSLVYGAAGTLNFSNTVEKPVVTGDFFWPTTSPPFNVNVLAGGINVSSGARIIGGILSTASKGTTNGITTAASMLTVNGTVRIDNGGGFGTTAASAPIYGASSLLLYNTGIATTNRGNEWTNATANPGYPKDVQISNNTTVRCNTTSTARGMAGNFTIDSGSTFDMTAGSLPTVDFLIAGSVINNGTFKFSTAASTTAASVVVTGDYTNSGTTIMANTLPPAGGGHLRLSGNFSNGVSGVFTANNKFVQFAKTGTQTVQNLSASPLVFSFVQTLGTGTTIQLLNDLTISAPAGFSSLIFGNAADVFDINGKTLTIGTTGIGNSISGASGTFKGSTTSNLTLLGSGSIGTVRFATNQNLGTFTMDKTAAALGCVMGSALTINTSLVLTNGLIDLGANTMTLASTCSNTFTASANSFVVANVTAGGILSKAITATGTTYNFPIGDNTGTVEYSPASVNYTSGTVDATSFLGMAVDDSKETNFNSTTDFLTRYWSLTNVGTFTSPVYDFTGTYTNSAADVTGTIGTYYKSNQWDGSDWTNGGITLPGTGILTKTGCTLATGTNHITAGIRDPEIDVRGGGNIIASGATTTNGLNKTAFGTQTLASNTANTFTIFNRGGSTLNLTGAPLVSMSGSSDFAVTTVPGTSAIGAESSTTFIITFTPTTAGYKTATVSIANTDTSGGENPYTFVVDGTGQCAVTSTNTITPTSGPVGTEVSITATAGTLTSATAYFNALSASVTQIDATHITAIVPTGAVSGTLITTNNLGCQATNTFTVIDNASTSCEGGSTAGELFMSEVTDSNAGALSYVEIYNGTGSAKNLSTYSLKVANNGGAYAFTLALSNVSLPNGSSYIVALGNDGFCGATGITPAQSNASGSINFAVGGHDHIGLFNSLVSATNPIDSFGIFGSNNWAPASISTEGASFRRKNTATLPNPTYSNSDWNIIDYLGSGAGACSNNDYSDIGVYNFRTGVPPLVTTLSYTPTCKATTLTVTGTEGFVGSNPLVYTWFAVANGSNTWNLISNGGIYSGATTNALTISDVATILNYQFYCQVRENTATCYIASNAVKITASQSTTWQVGNTWSNSVPTINTPVIIDNDYDTANGFSPSFDACSVTINNLKTVTIRATNYANIQNDLTVNSGGTLNVESDGSLVMIDDNGVVTNNGTTNIKRTAAAIRGFDYVYWSSPVIGQSIDAMYSSPAPGLKYKWNPLAANINSPVSSGRWELTSGTMLPATGYIVRGSTTYSMPATSIPSVFTGAVNNGIVPVTISRGSNTTPSTVGPGNGVTISNLDDNWNLVGNPYASSIRALDFLNYNTNIQGFVYLWTHLTAPAVTANPFYNSFAYNYTSNDYTAYNGTATTSGPTGFNGYIASGQGFFVIMNDGATGSGTVNFKNSMRNKTYGNTQFYRTSQAGDEKHRIWIDLVDSNNVPYRTVVGYVPEATYGLDRLYDAYKNTANEVGIYSLAENETLIIQGRALPFDENDRVPLGVRIMQDGNYKIAIAAVDGLFEEGQSIYLEDKLLGITFDLRQNPYSFSATAGIINDRFVLKYTDSTLGNPDLGSIENSVAVATNHGEMTIKSAIEAIEEVTVYDILGRQLFESKNIGSNNFTTSNISMSQQALIVKIKLANGLIVTRKILL